MFITYSNAKGATIDFTSGDIRLVSIEGLSPTAIINTSETSGFDGSTFISAQMPKRNIVILISLSGYIEGNRHIIYDVFRTKQKGTLFFKSDIREAKIDCYTEKTPFTLMATSTEIQVSLICPQPYFESITTQVKKLASVTPLFRFPFRPPIAPGTFKFSDKSDGLMVNVENNSDVDVGMTVVFYASSALSNPSLLNVNTGEKMQMDFDMLANDTITINTQTGKKTKIILLRNGVETNIINSKAIDFRFMKLRSGNNLFRYDAGSNLNGLQVSIYYSEYYSGV